MQPLYLATERFDPSDGEAWSSYVAWRGLTQLTELVSPDGSLGPLVIAEPAVEDEPYILHENFRLHLFTDLPHLLRRVGMLHGRNLLCMFVEPERQPEPPAGPFPWVYEGCDLLDVTCGPSALTSCGGGFPLAFADDELTSHGLLRDLTRAREVQRALRLHYPDEDHANCHVWSVFRATTATS